MKTQILAIDPGNTKSGVVLFSVDKTDIYGIKISDFNGGMDNEELLDYIEANKFCNCYVVIECMKPQGMNLSGESMETLIFIGRLCERIDMIERERDIGLDWTYVFRQQAKLHLCGQARAKDANVSQALRDRFGGCQKPIKCDSCKGKGKSGRGKDRQPCADCDGSGLERIAGPLHKISNHAWAALAVGIWFADNKLVQRRILNAGGRDNRSSGVTKVSFD